MKEDQVPMFKFFRGIRQNLLVKGNFRRYLLYAVGEILLVVIGILIALQVNNWNERRKERNLETQYKYALLRDLKIDLASIQVRIGNAQVRISSAERLLGYLEEGGDYEEFEKREDLLRSGWLNFFSPTLGTYQDLISSGNIKLILDDSLKFLLNDYVAHNDRILLYEEHDKKNVWNEYGLYYRKWVDGRMSAAYLVSDKPRVLSYPLPWDKIRADSDLKRRLTLTLETNYGQIARYERLMLKIENLINYLEQ